MAKEFLTVKEVAKILGLSYQQVRYLIQKGKLKATAETIEHIEYKIRPDDVKEMLDERKEELSKSLSTLDEA